MNTSSKTLPAAKENYYPVELRFSDYKTYLFSMLFVAGNIALPYALHQFNLAGQVFLPIYFFVLVASYKFGWRTGLITALCSPLISFFLTSMPVWPILPYVIAKSVFLALAASLVASIFKKLSIVTVAAAVLLYQLAGIFLIYLLTSNINLAFQDVTIGWPGLLVQVFVGCSVLSLFRNYENQKS